MAETNLSRRRFLKASGLMGLTAVVNGCADVTRKLIPFVTDPEDIIPGEATWYATTCRECPAGCGMLAKNRDGRVIKVEGNPLHPINAGKLCPRGQAAVQGPYSPDRYREPAIRNSDGSLSPLSWEDAERIILTALASPGPKGRRNNVAFITDLTTGAEKQLVRRFLESTESADGFTMYEPLAYEPLRRANEVVFGTRTVPLYRIDKADLLISFSADFLETWVSNVQFARQFAAFREPGTAGKNPFVYIGPRLSVTGANADKWIAVPPGGQSIVAFGLLHMLLMRNHAPALRGAEIERLKSSLSPFTSEYVRSRTGVQKEALEMLAGSFVKAKKPLVLAEGLGCQDPEALDSAIAAGFLSRLGPGGRHVIDVSRSHALSDTARASDMRGLTERMRAGEVDIVFISRANPVFHFPAEWHFSEALKSARLVVSLSAFPDETNEMAHVILPTHTFLESWGEYEPESGVRSLMQPVTGPIFNTRQLGDILLSLGCKLKGAEEFPEKDFYEILQRSWAFREARAETVANPRLSWQQALQSGGSWVSPGLASPSAVLSGPSLGGSSFSRDPRSPIPDPRSSGQGSLSFISYPTIQFFDGRTANRPFLRELPDPVTAITWEGWVEINPETAGRYGIAKGDLLTIKSEAATGRVAVYPYPGIAPGVLAMPMGYNRNVFSRYTHSDAGQAARSGGKGLDPAGGSIGSPCFVTIEKTGIRTILAHTDGSSFQHGRDIVRSIGWREYLLHRTDPPDVTLPLPRGFAETRDFYPPHHHETYRWCMVVDLDRCVGCGACVVACYAENNVPVVGRKEILKGRTMAWLRIERYFEPEEPFVRFLPMMCQHCDEAPCEAVCPVFAPHHNKEGINNQVYPRCIGTRFCSQNCPYKVRRFNWHTWKPHAPLEWQLNPDVTVRTKGVMEKCSFCIQRIVAAKISARSEGRALRDGEFTTACAQTCPTDALVFGNLKDPESRVAKLVALARAYQVLGDLNTKPGVIYLKKITRGLP
jgi:anaerobic selenocysteine-containing dehydrogenase/Fe-S-cluster-containing dehydrogenase component